MTVGIPVMGEVDRSLAITHAEPRKKAKGEQAMRPMRSGISCFCRPLLLAMTVLMGSGRFFDGDHSAWTSRGIDVRSFLPSARRCSQDKGFRPRSNFGRGCNLAIAILPSRPSNQNFQKGRSGREETVVGVIWPLHWQFV